MLTHHKYTKRVENQDGILGRAACCEVGRNWGVVFRIPGLYCTRYVGYSGVAGKAGIACPLRHWGVLLRYWYWRGIGSTGSILDTVVWFFGYFGEGGDQGTTPNIRRDNTNGLGWVGLGLELGCV